MLWQAILVRRYAHAGSTETFFLLGCIAFATGVLTCFCGLSGAVLAVSFGACAASVFRRRRAGLKSGGAISAAFASAWLFSAAYLDRKVSKIMTLTI